MHTKSDSDVTSSVDPSSPRSPKRQLYYVQSPSRDSHDGDKSSSMQATPAYNSPMESPSHPSYSRHSRASSASRFSGNLKKGRNNNNKRNEKGWTECNVIEEEGDYGEYFYGDKGLTRRCQIFMGVFGFVAVFSLFCLIIWGASRPYKPQIAVKSLTVHNFYFGEGADMTGVPTKMLTMNCSVRLTVHNPATFFGIHVTSNPVDLMYSEIVVATGQVKYYQPRKSSRSVVVNLQGDKVPLYGAGASLAVSDNGGGVPMKLIFDVRSKGNVVGKLVRSRHRKRISCSLVIDSHSNKPLKLNNSSCQYD
ncbi:Late embryogenesis abundant protein, LEA-14 [Corchorus olitorius]|uniref:Late embryogenesis abundant protein, LEA-14 n=1 Tax=Corchorus olitorius TaxID=93759 RepID=A0A1R3GJD2_9ROSI|nr:Late embryogenesis abundant protein, LEA-14 [Corchorus olitorius]